MKPHYRGSSKIVLYSHSMDLARCVCGGGGAAALPVKKRRPQGPLLICRFFRPFNENAVDSYYRGLITAHLSGVKSVVTGAKPSHIAFCVARQFSCNSFLISHDHRGKISILPCALSQPTQWTQWTHSILR